MMPASVASWRLEANALDGAPMQAINKAASNARRTDVTDMGLSLGTARPTKARGNRFTGLGDPWLQCSPSLELTTANQFAARNLSALPSATAHITRSLGKKSYREALDFPGSG